VTPKPLKENTFIRHENNEREKFKFALEKETQSVKMLRSHLIPESQQQSSSFDKAALVQRI
jgi:hypothetical protein